MLAQSEFRIYPLPQSQGLTKEIGKKHCPRRRGHYDSLHICVYLAIHKDKKIRKDSNWTWRLQRKLSC